MSEKLFHRRAAFRGDCDPSQPIGANRRLRFALRVIVFGLSLLGRPLLAGEQTLKAPEGFEVSLFADDDLAHDIHCLTIDSRGRITVAGNGYIKTLIDSDDDGIADKAELFAEGPAIGVQGMYWHGSDLLAVGGEGLLRFRDRNGDEKADGPPDVLLKIKCGGEHTAHSIQRGPDGCWYLIAGNDTGVDSRYVTLPSSPVKQPEAGVLFRMRPDISGGDVVAHGMRNAYDFAFNRMADVFTYDSDDERDVSLPWYRPTRVFHLLPGSHAGWVTRSWKRPDEFLDMPPVVAAAGRGSPTGVVSYQHRQFPKKYHEALFVLDWTFGRVIALPLVRSGSSWKTESELFLSSAGDHGFAPTDAEVGPDGSLFVSVGGRGTRGGVWRVRYNSSNTGENANRDNADDSNATLPEDASTADRLVACLNSPQPLSSWSRARWQPLARQVGREAFFDAARNDDLLPAVRLRAIDVLTELFGGIDATEAASLSNATPADVRAKAIWSLGRTHANPLDGATARPFLEDSDPLVNRLALEAILSAENLTTWSPLVSGLIQQLSCNDRFNRLTASRLIARLNQENFQTLSQAVVKEGWQATLMYAVGYLPRSTASTKYAIKVGLSILEGQHPPSLKLQAARLLQLALGDLVPAGGLPAFEAYSTRLDLSAFERDLDPLRIRLAETFPTGDADVDRELSRALAMLALANTKLLDKVLAKITDGSDPVEDIHYLLVSARIPTPRNRTQAETIARGLVRLEPKLVARKMNLDLNWDDRVGELYRELAKLDNELADQLVAQPEFGRPGHVLFLSQLPQDLLPKVIDSYVKTISSDADYPWNNDVAFLIGESKEPEHRDLLRQQFDRFNIRGAVLVVLARQPEERDRAKFVEGLEESRLEVLTACVDALTKLSPTSEMPSEQVALLRALRRLGTDEKELPIRDNVAKLLARNFGRDFGFVFGQSGYRPQNEAIQRWTEFLTSKYPSESGKALGGDAESLTWLKEQLAQVDWSTGDLERGRVLFEKRSCAQCHGGRRGLGPDLAGVTSRFSRDDLFIAIVLPNRDVSTRYQTTLVETKQGKVHTGLIVYESAEGFLLRNSTNQTVRIETANVETRRTLPQSLMPGGLIKEFRSSDFADLLAYLKSLGRSPTPASTTAR